MLRLTASQVLFRLSMLFLHTNELVFVEKMKSKNGPEVDNHKRKIRFLLDSMCPSASSKGIVYSEIESFQKLEKLVGHDFFVKAIMSNSKSGKNKPLYAKGIPKVQWNRFVTDQEQKYRKKPSRNTMFNPTIYKDSKPSAKTVKKLDNTKRKERKQSPAKSHPIKKTQNLVEKTKAGKWFNMFENTID